MDCDEKEIRSIEVVSINNSNVSCSNMSCVFDRCIINVDNGIVAVPQVAVLTLQKAIFDTWIDTI